MQTPHGFHCVRKRMNTEKQKGARRYRTALRKHLDQRSDSGLEAALGLGHQAVTLELEPLDLAQIHDHALKSVAPFNSAAKTRHKRIDRAKSFFAKTIVPIENTHRAAIKDNASVHKLTQTLRRRTEESSASNRRLKRSITQRQAAEATLKKSDQHHVRLLQESSHLKKRLRVQTREMLTSQEQERRRTSRQLHDDIAQTLVAINLRLLTLKKAAKANTAIFEKEIAQTQRLVRESMKPIHRLAHEYGIPHET